MLGSPVDIAIAAVVVLIVFGPKKVPELGKALGQGIGNFKRALTEGSEEFKTAMNTDTQTAGEAKIAPASPSDQAAPVSAIPPAKEEPAPPA